MKQGEELDWGVGMGQGVEMGPRGESGHRARPGEGRWGLRRDRS